MSALRQATVTCRAPLGKKLLAYENSNEPSEGVLVELEVRPMKIFYLVVDTLAACLYAATHQVFDRTAISQRGVPIPLFARLVRAFFCPGFADCAQAGLKSDPGYKGIHRPCASHEGILRAP